MTHMKDAVIIEPTDSHEFSVIWLHGLGADGNDFVPIVPQLNFPTRTNTRFIFPHAKVQPVTLNGGMLMRAWFDIANLDENAELDIEGIVESQARINDLINAEIDRGINSKNIILAGFSQGGSMTLVTGLSFPKPLGGLIALSCFIPPSSFHHLALSDANHNTDLFIGHGEMDMIVPLAMGKHANTLLQERGYPVQWHEYPMDHSVCIEELADLSGFLGKTLT